MMTTTLNGGNSDGATAVLTSIQNRHRQICELLQHQEIDIGRLATSLSQLEERCLQVETEKEESIRLAELHAPTIREKDETIRLPNRTGSLTVTWQRL